MPDFWIYLISFLAVLSVVVFVHELGHYLVARWNGVAIEVFSIGFGPELFGWTDRAGTRWKVSALPLGGYVKMLGDADVASATAADEPVPNPENTFRAKNVWQRIAIVAAGPLANFVFAIVVLAALFVAVGQPYTPPVVGEVQPGSAAAAAGFQPGDVIVRIEDEATERFEEVQEIIRGRAGEEVPVTVRRDGEEIPLVVVPTLTEVTDRFGNVHRIGVIGVSRSGIEVRRLDPLSGGVQAVTETVRLIGATLAALGEMIAGTRTTEELGGPLRIAQMSGQVAQDGVVPVLWFVAVLSINLGLINLFPIPMLDGGHLVFYAVEAVRGRPVSERAQEYAFRFGLAMVLTLMVFATWNDLVHLKVFEFMRGLVS
jgi:regulator of sigma E protease